MTATDVSLIAGGVVLVISALAAAVVAILKQLGELKKAAAETTAATLRMKDHVKNVEVLSLVSAQKMGVVDSELAIPIRDTPVAVMSGTMDKVIAVKASEVVKQIKRTIIEETTVEPEKK